MVPGRAFCRKFQYVPRCPPLDEGGWTFACGLRLGLRLGPRLGPRLGRELGLALGLALCLALCLALGSDLPGNLTVCSNIYKNHREQDRH